MALSVYAFILPFAMLVHDLLDRGLRNGKVPRFAFRQHRSLSKRLGPWARQRERSGRAAHLSLGDISGTEWPMFGCVFYQWATEALQEAWESNPSLSAEEPAAPHLGEACLLFNLTRSPAPGLALTSSRSLPLLVYLGAAAYLGIGLLLGWLGLIILQFGR